MGIAITMPKHYSNTTLRSNTEQILIVVWIRKDYSKRITQNRMEWVMHVKITRVAKYNIPWALANGCSFKLIYAVNVLIDFILAKAWIHTASNCIDRQCVGQTPNYLLSESISPDVLFNIADSILMWPRQNKKWCLCFSSRNCRFRTRAHSTVSRVGRTKQNSKKAPI